MKNLKRKTAGVVVFFLILQLLLPISSVQAADLPGNSTAQISAQVENGNGVRIYSDERLEAYYHVTGKWDGGRSYNADIILINRSSEPIQNWSCAFMLGNRLTNIWNARILKEADNCYQVKNAGWNQDIEPGAVVSFGITGEGDYTAIPYDFKLTTRQMKVDSHDFACSYNVNSDWGTGFNSEITIRNTGTEAIEDWCLEFDFEGMVYSIWNGITVSSGNGHFIVRNAGYNRNLNPGEAVSIGINGGRGIKQPVPACFVLRCYRVFSAEAVKTYTDPSEYGIGAGDNLTDDIIDIGDIEFLRSKGQLEVFYDSDGRIGSLTGDFYGKKLESAADAAEMLNAASPLWGEGFSATAADIDSEVLDLGYGATTYYTFQPVKNGVKVQGNEIKVVVDEYGRIQNLFNYFDASVYSADTTAAISAEEAEGIALGNLLSKEVGKAYLQEKYQGMLPEKEQQLREIRAIVPITSELCLDSSINEDCSELIYEVNIGFPFAYTYRIYAGIKNTGTIISAFSNNVDILTTAKDRYSKEKTFEVTEKYNYSEDRDVYLMSDEKRNIKTRVWKGALRPGDNSDVYYYGVDEEPDTAAVSAQVNIEAVYDYYKNVLGRDSYDDKGAEINVYLNYPGLYKNACSMYGTGIMFSEEGDLTSALDIMGHEFTHAVISDIHGSGMGYPGETAALNESYSDIMGNLIEGKTDYERWIIGEDANITSRSLRYPKSGKGGAEHYSELLEAPEECFAEDVDNGNAHYFCGIFNKASYLMMSDDRTASVTGEEWAKVFYGSMFTLPRKATFLDARRGVIAEANGLGFSSEQLAAIREAFDEVGVVETNNVRIVLTWGADPDDLDVHLIGPKGDGSEFQLAWYRKKVGGILPSGIVSTAAELDRDDKFCYGPETIMIRKTLPGRYYIFIHDYTDHFEKEATGLADSEAEVIIYLNNNQAPLRRYSVPDGVGNYWQVCAITFSEDENGVMTSEVDDINKIVIADKYYDCFG